jgi:isobutyryl-CoA mutase
MSTLPAAPSRLLQHPVRFVTAASLFDGHDAAINLMRRLLQASGAEVIHLGHNRSVQEIIDAAIQEDVQAIAISSYQGGHVEFFKYMIDLLRQRGAQHIKVFGGGGGVIIAQEIADLEAYGVAKIYSPEDGRRMGLQGMIDHMLSLADFDARRVAEPIDPQALRAAEPAAIARAITAAELDGPQALPFPCPRQHDKPVIGITGTGGAGKSSLTDELIRRLRLDQPSLRVAILSVDPSRRRSGGALLGDRIRMNAIHGDRVYMRSLATRGSRNELSAAIQDAIGITQAAGFDLTIVETSGIGQGDAAITEVADLTLYVMTSEFGASTQLEKIDMLDFAQMVVLNKFERRGAADALRDIRKQWRRNHPADFSVSDEALPVFATIASRFNDDGVNALYLALLDALHSRWPSWGFSPAQSVVPANPARVSTHLASVIPPSRVRYLSDIADAVRAYHRQSNALGQAASDLYRVEGALRLLSSSPAAPALLSEAERLRRDLPSDARAQIEEWPSLTARYRADSLTYQVRGRDITQPLTTLTLSDTPVPRVSLPTLSDWGDILRWRRAENLPGYFPFTAGIFPLKRTDEDPKRQFAGEGPPSRTNRRFHYLTRNDPARRLSTAFDSVTLYGADPDLRPDIFGKIGESGVSVCCLDDMKTLYSGFDLCDPNTSVSMTINGPAPIILAMFLNTAIDQQVDLWVAEHGGLAPSPAERADIQARALAVVRGTVQADILKEDQAQNTCIFSIDFALKMMGDIQSYFIEHRVRNYYSVSISGYHIAEAGANPISQLAFTLANGFTFVEYYLSRGMRIDDFAPSLSFFFSNGLDAEYSVIGRVARRIWAIAMRDRYGASSRAQQLKYHIQTSGRSLHAQEVDFNDIRTTIQALTALYDNCNSLHTNAFDEAVTTPTEASVRRAMAIQLIATREFGLLKNENALQGSFIIDALTDLVEAAVLSEFDRISERGGVLGAMETQYQRGKIQDESMKYEVKKHNGELPIIGVNAFLSAAAADAPPAISELARASHDEKRSQLDALAAFHATHAAASGPALASLRRVALSGGNIFAELMHTVRCASLGQITQTLYEVGGQYRRAL